VIPIRTDAARCCCNDAHICACQGLVNQTLDSPQHRSLWSTPNSPVLTAVHAATFFLSADVGQAYLRRGCTCSTAGPTCPCRACARTCLPCAAIEHTESDIKPTISVSKRADTCCIPITISPLHDSPGWTAAVRRCKILHLGLQVGVTMLAWAAAVAAPCWCDTYSTLHGASAAQYLQRPTWPQYCSVTWSNGTEHCLAAVLHMPPLTQYAALPQQRCKAPPHHALLE
jgi:hypothetical protein